MGNEKRKTKKAETFTSKSHTAHNASRTPLKKKIKRIYGARLTLPSDCMTTFCAETNTDAQTHDTKFALSELDDSELLM